MNHSLPFVLTALLGSLALAQETPPTPAPGTATEASLPAPAKPATPPRADGLLAFSFDLYRPLAAQRGGGENLALSPACLGNLLDVLAVGADGKTEVELRRILHHPAEGEVAPVGSLIPTSDAAAGLVVKQAVGVWTSPAFQPKPEYLTTLKERFGATSETLDFTKASEAAARINAWAAEQTEGKIPTLVAPAEFTEQSRLAAVSALYFKAAWADHFDPAKTKLGKFRLAGGKTVPAPMMQGKLRARFTEWPNGTKALALDFQGGSLTFLALLPPDTANALPVLEASLTPEFLRAVHGSLKPERVEVTLPRFAINASTPPRPLLAGLGVETLFREADFSRMTSERDLAVTSMNHQVAFAVDEAGAEGAAAASAVVSAKGIVVPKQFIADRPFVFLVLHRESLAPLILGRLANPAPAAAAAPRATVSPRKR